MLARLGAFTVRRRRAILIGTVIFAIASGAFGGKVVDKLSSGGFSDPNSESVRADTILQEQFGGGNPNLILLITANEGSVDDPEVVGAGQALTKKLGAEPEIEQVFSYWSLGSPPPLRSGDSSQALILARISGNEDEVNDAATRLFPLYTTDEGPISVGVGGYAEVFREVGEQIESDLAKAEALTFPIVLILLVLIFGSVVAAGTPLAMGALAVVGTLFILRIMVSITDVSIYALNLTTAMGLGLGIDYSLFIVSRFREEMRAGLDPHAAVIRAVETAGRTVLFSGLTVAISLAALMVFPLFFLRSFAYAGIAVVTLACIGAIVFLPALLAALGPKIDKLVLFHREPKDVGEGFWHRVAVIVMRRPVVVTVTVVGILLFLGSPFLGVKFGLPDDRVLPVDAPSRRVHDELRENFSSVEAAALSVVAADAGEQGAERIAAIHDYAADLSRIPNVSRVDALTGSYIAGSRVVEAGPSSARFEDEAGTWFSVVGRVEPISAEGEELARDVRAAEGPFETMVTGQSAELIDSKSGIFGRIPLAALLIGLTTFIILFLMTGSVLVPIKAVILNLLSLTATFGAMVWMFQDGHGSGLLDFTAPGFLDSTNPILMFCIAFGLSMDYEVFLLSRIKEEYDISGDNEHSVAVGLERTGRIVTAAAALLAVVFIAFATSKISFIKMFGIGLTLAVIMDATLIRGALVPAFMRLAGNANWWAPPFLRKIHDRIGLKESPSHPSPSEASDGLAAPAETG